MMSNSSTAIVVTYRNPTLDLSFVPDDAVVLIVHNDDSLEKTACWHPRAIHLGDGSNIGFGAAVNLALAEVTSPRVILLNPDVSLPAAAWHELANAGADVIATVRLVDHEGNPTSVLAEYPTPLSLTLTAWRAGRAVPRPVRRRLASLGGWSGRQAALFDAVDVERPLRTHWVSGAVCSLPTAVLRAAGGFDEEYFLYLEDTDLCSRLASIRPDMRARIGHWTGVHGVSMSSTAGPDAAAVGRHTDRMYAQSALRYAQRFEGFRGVAVRAAIRFRLRLLRRS